MTKMTFLIMVLFLAGCVTTNNINNTIQNNTNLNNTSDILVGDGVSVVLAATTGSNCTETDDGIDYGTKGITTSGRMRAADRCSDEETLKEYSCNGSAIRTTLYDCSSGCSDGKCNSEVQPFSDTPDSADAPAINCEETDNWKDYDQKGTTTSATSSGTVKGTDVCIVDMLMERYCKSDNSIGIDVQTCTYGCTDGKCDLAPATITCIDTDDNTPGTANLDSYFEKGTTTSTGGTGDEKVDKCFVNVLWERYCKNDKSIGTEQYTCTNGCTEGKCNPVTCTEDDGGQNYGVKGTATKGTWIKTDKCDGGYLYEYFCQDGDLYEEGPKLCNYGCSDGKCNSAPSIATCIDSDDNTLGAADPDSYFEKGTTTKGTSSQNDLCIAGIVMERYCKSDGSIGTDTHGCAYGCIDGKCNPATLECTETDNGPDVNFKGTAIKGESVYTDKCEGNYIFEYYCEDGDMWEGSQLCTYGCSNGQCNPETAPTVICNDNDNGKNYTVKGTTTLSGDVPKYDSCNAGSGDITEWWCPTESTRSSFTYHCQHGCLAANDYCNSAPSLTCTDDDDSTSGAADFDSYFEKGTVTTGIGSAGDYCVPSTLGAASTSLMEKYCKSDGSVGTQNYNCIYGCTDGKCNPGPEDDVNTAPVVTFNSPTGKRMVLIINDLPSFTDGEEVNDIVSLGIGQTEDQIFEVLEERETYSINLGEYPQTIDQDESLHTTSPATLPQLTPTAANSDASYRYFEIPDGYTTPYYIDVYYGRWDAWGTGGLYTIRISQILDCDCSTQIGKSISLDINSHPAGKVLAIKMSGYTPVEYLCGSEFCG